MLISASGASRCSAQGGRPPTWTLVGQAAKGARDEEAITIVAFCEGQTTARIKWLTTQLKRAARQALLVAA
jgi:hypothetical protein